MKTLSYKYVIYVLTVLVLILESIVFWKCVNIFKFSLGPGSFNLSNWCLMVLHITQYTIHISVFGAILLFLLGIKRKDQTYVFICLTYLVIWSLFILGCIFNLSSFQGIS